MKTHSNHEVSERRVLCRASRSAYVLLLVSCLVLAACSDSASKVPKYNAAESRPLPDEWITEEYAVYDSLIQAKHERYARAGSDLIVISSRSSIYRLSSKTLDETLKWASNHNVGGIRPELIENLVKQNQQSYEISDLFHLDVKHVLVTKERIDELMKEGEWELFYKKYPKSQGLVILSRVGFDAGRNQALVYFGNPTSATSGEGTYVLLEKQNGRWVIKQEIPMWTI